ncbi:MAG: hypothetical protein UY16_C0008G0023 [Candidatus Gottesmanbacteria bacterium GW2011_GWA2_47_9]|uniref:Uncharacterized protein n=2 Tax=Microgenomates group TaxID=1794810 RepID=A0A0G0XVT7_9BACT|nr:MAG: hypothetical protein UU42_C0005G0010 [Candidatus Woesebacteria bacterium GW2011_GWA1_41_13b]KKU88376.1 MAG: hypothetical protein UY16_C0008G0023 [Candidatus Gottesmanbacteria bacterium GW2011_GWA2_47_9]
MTDQAPDQLQLTEEEKNKLKELVLARLTVMPQDISISIGDKNLDKKALSEHVESEDEIGKQMMEMELEFLQDLASGAIYGHE